MATLAVPRVGHEKPDQGTGNGCDEAPPAACPPPVPRVSWLTSRTPRAPRSGSGRWRCQPAQDRAGCDRAMTTQGTGQSSDEGGEHRPVCPVQAWSRAGSAKDGDLMPQHEQLDVLGRRATAQQHDQAENLQEDQTQQPERHGGDHAERSEGADHRRSAACAEFWNPTGHRPRRAAGAGYPGDHIVGDTQRTS
jgi:hypothetical protein